MSRRATVRFEPSGIELVVPHGTTLLEAARRAGLPIASACDHQFTCGRCGMRLLRGDADVAAESNREVEIKSRNRIDAGLRLSCVVRVRGDLTVTTPYW
jgi:uncharacterized 2Fe-2S/4Fe-4S cluster protein (DUF4445 family)